MNIKILMEDTCGNPACAYEHGLSVYVETKRHRLLVDTGASAKTWENAGKLGVDLTKIDTVILSHGHYDHSGGILTFAKINPNAVIYMQKKALGGYYHGDRYIGIDTKIGTLPQVKMIENDMRIDEELSLFTHIEGRKFWPKSNLILSEKIEGQLVQDEFSHEQCLVVHGEKNLLISGCAHNGILNILDRYRELYEGEPDAAISGFHMMKKTDYTREEADIIVETARELAKLHTVFYTGHCTGQKAMDLMKPIMGEQLVQIHSGMNYIL